MAQPLSVAFPPELTLTDGWRVSIRAVNPANGADVAGVRITEALIEVEVLEGLAALEAAVGPFMLVPGPGASL